MPMFEVTVRQTVEVTFEVEADDESEVDDIALAEWESYGPDLEETEVLEVMEIDEEDEEDE